MKDPKGEIKSLGPQNITERQPQQCLGLGNDKIEWRMDCRYESYSVETILGILNFDHFSD